MTTNPSEFAAEIRTHNQFYRPRATDGRLYPAHINGIGAVTGYGWGTKALFDGLASGESAVVRHDTYEGYIDNGYAYLALIEDLGEPKDGISRFTRALRYSGREAVKDALARGWRPGPNVGVIEAAALPDSESWAQFYQIPTPKPRVKPKVWVNLMPSSAPQAFAKEFGFHGPQMTITAQCAAGNMAMIQAKIWLDAGLVSDVIILNVELGGVGDNIRGFVDTRVCVVDKPPFEASQPFQQGGYGFVGGEAATAVVVSADPTGTYASMLGGAATGDAFAPIGIDQSLVQLKRSYTEALENAGVDVSEVSTVNAHGSGTRACDQAETAILDTLFPHAQGLYSLKPLIGHCQSAAPLAELLGTIYAFETGVIPAPPQMSPGYERAIFGPTPRRPGLEIKASIGMGGYNTVVILENPNDSSGTA
jgi:3-oxoacyl-[acyl-carrier-protein] synthase II